MAPHSTLPTVLVADADPSFRLPVETWLAASGYRVQSAANGSEALAIASQHRVDVLVTDLRLPGLNGLDLMAILKERSPATQVIVFAAGATVEEVIDVFREGRAFDFLLKPLDGMAALTLAIEKALHRKQRSPRPDLPVPSGPLSDRERQIVSLLVEGHENRGIAERLQISENTVKNHLARIYEKLKVSNRVQAALTCDRMGWL